MSMRWASLFDDKWWAWAYPFEGYVAKAAIGVVTLSAATVVVVTVASWFG